MNRNVKIERISNIVYRLSINDFDVSNEEYLFNEIIKTLIEDDNSVLLVGYRENSFWKSDDEINLIKKGVIINFNRIGYFKIIKENSFFILAAKAKIINFNSSHISEIINFWNLFESVFIFQDSQLIEDFGENITFSKYINLLENKSASYSVAKSENNTMCIDSTNLDILDRVVEKHLN